MPVDEHGRSEVVARTRQWRHCLDAIGVLGTQRSRLEPNRAGTEPGTTGTQPIQHRARTEPASSGTDPGTACSNGSWKLEPGVGEGRGGRSGHGKTSELPGWGEGEPDAPILMHRLVYVCLGEIGRAHV